MAHDSDGGKAIYLVITFPLRLSSELEYDAAKIHIHFF